jgi:hypothetical protein
MRPLSAALAFASTVVVSATIIAFLRPGLNAAAAWGSVACGTIAGLAAWLTTRPHKQSRATFWDSLMLLVFALVSLRAFLWVIYARGDEICVLSPNNLGDLSLHLNLIRYLASGIPFWPESSILSKAPLTYPIGADLFNSVLELCGVDTFKGLIWTGLVGAALAGYALWLWGGAFGVAAFLLNGGLAGFAILRTFQIEDFQSEMVWKNFFLSMFVTQRGLLYALPAGLLRLSAWRERYFRGSIQALPFWLQIVIYVSLPLFSIHAFLFLSAVLLAIFLTLIITRLLRIPRRVGADRAGEVIALVALSVIPAAAAILLVTGSFSISSGIRWAPYWVSGGSAFNLWTWIWNFGLSLPLAIVLALVLLWEKDHEARCFVWAATCVFVLCCTASFAPWEWDNMKLMLWSWLVIAPYLWTKILAPMHPAARAAICLVLFFSGGVSLLGGLDARHGYVIARRSELDAWRHAVAGIPADVRFASVPDYNHPLILLGRKVACGYEGHLWSHGLDYQRDLHLLRQALEKPESWRSNAPLLEVEWLGLRKSDLANFQPPGNPPPNGAVGVLYDLRPLLKQDPASRERPQLPPQPVDLLW